MLQGIVVSDWTRRPMILWYNRLHTGCIVKRYEGFIYISRTLRTPELMIEIHISRIYPPEACFDQSHRYSRVFKTSSSAVLPAPCNYGKLSISDASGVSQLPSLRCVALLHRLFLN